MPKRTFQTYTVTAFTLVLVAIAALCYMVGSQAARIESLEYSVQMNSAYDMMAARRAAERARTETNANQ